jgi:hypothetical protein
VTHKIVASAVECDTTHARVAGFFIQHISINSRKYKGEIKSFFFFGELIALLIQVESIYNNNKK